MHRPKPVIENELHKILMDKRITQSQAEDRPDLVLININPRSGLLPGILSSSRFWRINAPQSENERNRKDIKVFWSFAIEQKKKKAVEYKGDRDTNCSWCAWTIPKDLEIESDELEKNRDQPDNNVKIR